MAGTVRDNMESYWDSDVESGDPVPSLWAQDMNATLDAKARMDACTSDILPDTDLTHDLGSASSRWAQMYSKQILISAPGSENLGRAIEIKTHRCDSGSVDQVGVYIEPQSALHSAGNTFYGVRVVGGALDPASGAGAFIYGLRATLTGVSNHANIDSMYGIYIDMPASYGSPSTIIAAGLFAGNGEVVYFCNGTHALRVDAGAVQFDEDLSVGGDITVTGNVGTTSTDLGRLIIYEFTVNGLSTTTPTLDNTSYTYYKGSERQVYLDPGSDGDSNDANLNYAGQGWSTPNQHLLIARTSTSSGAYTDNIVTGRFYFKIPTADLARPIKIRGVEVVTAYSKVEVGASTVTFDALRIEGIYVYQSTDDWPGESSPQMTLEGSQTSLALDVSPLDEASAVDDYEAVTAVTFSSSIELQPGRPTMIAVEVDLQVDFDMDGTNGASMHAYLNGFTFLYEYDL